MRASIHENEKARRRVAVDFARASVGLEGFTITPEHEAHAQRYVDGEIDLVEFLKPRLASSPAMRNGSRNDQDS